MRVNDRTQTMIEFDEHLHVLDDKASQTGAGAFQWESITTLLICNDLSLYLAREVPVTYS